MYAVLIWSVDCRCRCYSWIGNGYGGVVLGGRRDERGRYMLSVYTNILGQSVGVLGEECGEGGAYVQYCVV